MLFSAHKYQALYESVAADLYAGRLSTATFCSYFRSEIASAVGLAFVHNG